jgi:phosphohistidine phosphatase SixA
MFKFFFIFILYFFYSNFSYAENNIINLVQFKKASYGKIIFVRHALAPGNGDPINFKIDDCSTQRNLNKEGKNQALLLGKILRKNGIFFETVYSSLWCRCLQTSKYMDVGKAMPHKGLNSFYENIVDKQETLISLNNLILNINHSSKPILMVTHYVVIQAMTGLSVSSGEMVVYDIKTKQSKYLKTKH